LFDGLDYQVLDTKTNCGPGPFRIYHFKVARTPDKISVELNGESILTNVISSYGLYPYVSRVGMFSYSKSTQEISDARFDNFHLTLLAGAKAPAYIPFSRPVISNSSAVNSFSIPAGREK
jgi:hypothetical protein